MLPTRSQLPTSIPEDSEESENDELPPMQAPQTRALRRPSASLPLRKQSPFASMGSSKPIIESEQSAGGWRRERFGQASSVLKRSLEAVDEEGSVTSDRSRAPSTSVYEFPCPRLSESIVGNMIKLSVLSEGRSRFGIVSKYVNKTTMAMYAVVEWDIHEMDRKQVKEVIARLEFISTLRHQRIGSVYGYHSDEIHLRIFRTFLPTGAVTDLLKNAPLPEDKAKKFFAQSLDALRFLHERNVAHGDIKASNLLVTLSGDIQMTDIALPHAPKPDKHKRRTLLHCAPEMFETMSAWENASFESDIWAIGCVLVTMVTRYPPFQDLFLSLSTQELHEKLSEVHRLGSSSRLNYASRTLIPTSSPDLAEMVDATFVEDPTCRPTAAELLKRFFLIGESRKTSRISEPSTPLRSSLKRETIEHNDLYNDGPTSIVADPAHKNMLERLYESAERRGDDEERPLLFCMKWYGSRILILLLLFLKWIGMVFLAALSLGFVAGSVFLSIYVIYKGIGVVCQCQLNEGFIVLIALILLPIIILLTTLCVNNSCEKYKQAQEDGSLEKCRASTINCLRYYAALPVVYPVLHRFRKFQRYVYPRPEDDIIICGYIIVDGRKENRKISVRRKFAVDESDPTSAANLPKGAFVRGVAGIA